MKYLAPEEMAQVSGQDKLPLPLSRGLFSALHTTLSTERWPLIGTAASCTSPTVSCPSRVATCVQAGCYNDPSKGKNEANEGACRLPASINHNESGILLTNFYAIFPISRGGSCQRLCMPYMPNSTVMGEDIPIAVLVNLRKSRLGQVDVIHKCHGLLIEHL